MGRKKRRILRRRDIERNASRENLKLEQENSVAQQQLKEATIVPKVEENTSPPEPTIEVTVMPAKKTKTTAKKTKTVSKKNAVNKTTAKPSRIRAPRKRTAKTKSNSSK